MKTTFFFACTLFASASLTAQVEIDQAIELTGTDGSRRVSNLELPVDANDAANKSYVDNAVSASGGGGLPTMLSDESGTTMHLGDAIRYCRNLEEDGFTDWRLPSFSDVIAAASLDSSVPNEDSAQYFHIVSYEGGYFGIATATGTSSRRHRAMRLSDGSLLVSHLDDTTSFRTRCVR